MAAGLAHTALTTPPKTKRVAFVASYAPSLTTFRGPLIRRITGDGHAMLCAAPDFDEKTKAELTQWGVETHTIPMARTGLNPLNDIETYRSLTELFRQWEPDVVMGYTPKPAIYASLAASRAGVDRIVPMITGLGYAFLEGGGAKGLLIRQIMSRLYARALRASHGVIFHNHDDAQVIVDKGIVPAKLPVTVTRGSGVDLDHYTPAPLPGLKDGVTFLMIARLVRYKGVAEYCEAARRLKADGLNARWLLVGPPESGPSGFPLDELDRLSDAVTYLGPSDDVRGALRDCHVYVLPSYGEGMPRTVLEAMATGRAIITTDTRGCRDTVADGANGSLVPIRNAEALAEAMRALIEAPNRIAPMAEKSREIAKTEFDVNNVNQTMLDALGLAASQEK